MTDTNINIRINEEIKESFYKVCESNLQTPSVVLREMIKEFIERGSDIFNIK